MRIIIPPETGIFTKAVTKVPQWVQRMNRVVSKEEEEQPKRCIVTGQPFGDPGWVESTAREYNLESTMRKRGRSRKVAQTAY